MNYLYELADQLLDLICPGTVRREKAGSLRRQKPDPKDIEIVCIPRIDEMIYLDLFGNPGQRIVVNHLDEALARLLEAGQWEFDPIVPRNGPAYKRLRHIETHAACDLFITDARRWGYTYTIRTGPAEFGHALVTRAWNMQCFFKDCLLHAHPPVFEFKGDKKIVRPCPRGENCAQIVETPDEPALFGALGLTCWPPAERGKHVNDVLRLNGA